VNTWTVVVDGIEIAVTAKRVRYLRLVVHPDGRVRASVPVRASRRDTEAFLRDRIAWVRAQQERLAARRPTPPPLVDGGTVRVWGEDVPLRVIAARNPANRRARTRLDAGGLSVTLPDPTDAQALAAAVAALYRRETAAVLDDLVAKWAAALGQSPNRVTLRTMRTRWGSCTPASGAIRINPDLAARHPRCLSYVVLHEMVHLSQPGHGPGFCAVMDAHLPQWRAVRAELNTRQPSAAPPGHQPLAR